MTSMADFEHTFFGLDLSTQQLKAVIVDENLKVIYESAVNFDTDLPEFKTQGGVNIENCNSNIITAPTIMWVKTLDLLMHKLAAAGVDFSKICAISGSAQQHGSVYWKNGSDLSLRNLDPKFFLHEQLINTFSITNSPVWMDSSTTQQCHDLEKAVGGPLKLAEITGSRAYERFTGSQILKILQTKPEAYVNSERISLVSSFLCSLFLGKIAAIDISDGSGMNLLDIRTKSWNSKLLEKIDCNLEKKLGSPVSSSSSLGVISSYFVDRYGFDSNCRIIAFTGDNSASLVGMRLNENMLAVSLGTSDTAILWLHEAKVILNGHILCNPIDAKAYMALLCFKNGSLTRERVRNDSAKSNWDIFNQFLEATPCGNFGNMGLFYDVQEILPFLSGDYRYNKAGELVSRFTSSEVEVRALIEGQFLAQRAYVEDFGFKLGSEIKILATGGASANKSILQVLANVFNTSVYIQEDSKSAMLGAAYQAKNGFLNGLSTYSEITACLPSPQLVCKPINNAAEIYDPMLQRYRKIVHALTKEQHLMI